MIRFIFLFLFLSKFECVKNGNILLYIIRMSCIINNVFIFLLYHMYVYDVYIRFHNRVRDTCWMTTIIVTITSANGSSLFFSCIDDGVYYLLYTSILRLLLLIPWLLLLLLCCRCSSSFSSSCGCGCCCCCCCCCCSLVPNTLLVISVPPLPLFELIHVNVFNTKLEVMDFLHCTGNKNINRKK